MPTLVVNQGAIGDLLLSLPALRLLKKHVGDFTLAGEPERCLFLKASGEVPSVFPANSAAFAQLYSGSIPPHLEYFDDIWWFTRRRGLIPTILMMPDSPKQTRVIFTVDEGPNETSCSVFQFEQLKSMLGNPNEKLTEFTHPLVHSKSCNERTGFHLAVHPGSGSHRKNFSLALFLSTTERLLNAFETIDCCFILGPAEKSIFKDVDQFARKWSGRVKIATGFDLLSLAQLLGQVKVFWGNDSGIAHLSAWCGAETFINFGPTNPGLWSPICGNVNVFQSGASCSPCGERFRRCEELICLDQLDTAKVFENLASSLKKAF